MGRSAYIIAATLALMVFRSAVFAADSGIISGRVYTEDNTEIIAEAKIYLHDPGGSILDSAFTSDTGSFIIEITPGEYLVSAGKANLIRRFYPGQYRFSEAARISVYPNQSISIFFYLERGGWIGGTFGYGGEDIEKGLITALKIDDPDAGWYKSVTLKGSFPRDYIIEGLIPGTYKILARATGKKTVYFPGVEDFVDATPIEVERDTGVPNISFLLEPVGDGMVSGRVLGVGIPGGIADIPVIAYQWRDFWEDPNLISALTGPDGSFDLQLPAGDYFFYADCDDCYAGSGRIVIYYENQFDPMIADAVTVVADELIEEIDFEFDFSSSYNLGISGLVINERTGQGLANAVVTAIDFYNGEAINSSLTASNGVFAIGNLPSGVYLVFFSSMNVIPYFYRGTENWQSAEIIDLQSNFDGIQSEAITQDYGNQVLAISGQVISHTGPVSSVRVYAYLTGESQPRAFARTNASGQYAILNGLVPGSYTVVCDLYGYDPQTYPEIIELDLLRFPEAENIDFFLEPQTTHIEGIEEAPRRFEIFGNYPNPFNAQTKIPVLSNYEDVRVIKMIVYDVLGRIVGEKLVAIKPGMNYIGWGINDFHGLAGSGVYFYRINEVTEARPMILLK
ncbi:MAG: carboxypeptidase regulatory-like domain-containing protein [candidate division Zixibacteria bacterium]